MPCIYRICIPADNHNSYIGYSKHYSPECRWSTHKSFSNHPLEKSQYIDIIINQYGIENCEFSVLFQSDLLSEEYVCGVLEPFYIKLYDSFGPNGYNKNNGGTKGQAGIKQTQDHINKRMKIVGPKQTGRPKPERTILRMRVSAKRGDSNGNTKAKEYYVITFQDGHEEIIYGIRKFCKERGYNRGCLYQVRMGWYKRHKDIIKVALMHCGICF